MTTEPDKTLSFGGAAMRRIRMHQTSAKPRFYELWYTYSTGINPALNATVDELFRRPQQDLNRELERVYEAHLAPTPATERVAGLERRLQAEIGQMMDAIAITSSTGASYSDSLNGAVEQLPAVAMDARALKQLAAKLLASTREMQQANAALDRRLQASRNEVEALNEALLTIRAEALTDSLTSLQNRRSFDLELTNAVTGADREGLSLVIADIDHFKQFNDNHGHLFGDQVLRLVATVIKSSVSRGATAARYGGEEFAIILPGHNGAAAFAIADLVRRDVTGKSIVNRSTGKSLGRLTLSAGVATYQAGDTPADLVERADACLYAAKRKGRNCVVNQDDLDLPLTA